MSHTITDKTKLRTSVVYGNQLTIHASIQTGLQALANGDKVIDISVVRKSVGNQFVAIISYELA
mgnify:FL=1